MLTELEKKIIASIQGDIPIKKKPYKDIAEALNISENTLLDMLKSLVDRGIIRRFGATLRHQLSGYGANALVTWVVPLAQVKRVGELLARHRAVTHYYHREPAPGWPYNLYSMLHGKDAGQIEEMAAQMAAEIGIQDYEILFSDGELKKTTMRYFREEAPNS